MKKKMFPLILILALLSSCETKTEREYLRYPCQILSVKHYGVGQLNTFQLDPLWEVTTECGTFKVRKEYHKGDTIWIYHVRNK